MASYKNVLSNVNTKRVSRHWETHWNNLKFRLVTIFHSPLPAPAKALITKTAMKTARHKIITTIRGRLFSFILARFPLCLLCAAGCAAPLLAFCHWQGGDTNTARWLNDAFTCALYTPRASEQLENNTQLAPFSPAVNLYIHTWQHLALIL